MLERKYQIEGMCCENCITHVKGALESIPQIEDMHIQIEEPQAVISLKEEVASDKILEVINHAGHYSAIELT